MRSFSFYLIVSLILVVFMSCRDNFLLSDNHNSSLSIQIVLGSDENGPQDSSRVIHEASELLTAQLTCSNGAVFKASAVFEQDRAEIRFDNIPVGENAALLINSEKIIGGNSIPLCSGTTNLEIVEGQNNVVVTMNFIDYEILFSLISSEGGPLAGQELFIYDSSGGETAVLTGDNGTFTYSINTENLGDLYTISYSGIDFSMTVEEMLAQKSNLRLLTDPAAILTAPGAPSLLSSGASSIEVNWTAEAQVESYLVKYNTVNDSLTALAVTSLMDADMTDTTATITGLVDGTYYYIWVYSQKSSTLSQPSEVTRGVSLAAGTDHGGADFSPTGTVSGTHYNVGTFSIPSGVTVTGSFTVYADAIDIQGTVNASGYGFSGGAGGSFGAGGTGNTHPTGYAGGAGGLGSGPNALGGGSGGAGGSAGQDFSGGGSDGGPGSVGGTGSSQIYYATGNGADETVVSGTGGSGGGGGGGGGGLDIANASVFGGSGGTGGVGGAGGGVIKLFSLGSLSLNGTIASNGLAGSSGNSGNPNTGIAGAFGHYGGAGGSGGSGGNGSGGGILLKGVDVNCSGGVIQSRGGSGDATTYGGEIKIYYENSHTTGTYEGLADFSSQFGF